MRVISDMKKNRQLGRKAEKIIKNMKFPSCEQLLMSDHL